MLTPKHVSELIQTVIKKVWLEDIKKDYDKLSLLKESSLQVTFCYHLRRRLGDDFLDQHNIKLYPEYEMGDQKADLAIVVIDPNMAKEKHLKYCTKEVISVIEMKHKNEKAPEKCFNDDVTKTLSYIKKSNSNTMYYLAFIREMYFNADDVTNWVTSKQALKVKGQLTELYSYGDLQTNKMIWDFIEH
ncbi:hypothetical protein [Priestia megaterium]|uniref:hypothetical protein n=1 Tax=Priestia megaterium TaxID=1404 RepID=UPI0022B92B2C|nr:hypothetical protein [Priestia megaterium]MCZ8493610.1 hypothetical protein [Priestia megaterium]